MILTLSANNGVINLPNIILDENKQYEIGVVNVGGFLVSTLSSPDICEVYYNGIQAMSGPNPYSILFYTIARLGFFYASGNMIYFPLRTNQLNATSIKFKLLHAATEFKSVFIQIEIRECNDKN